MFEFFDTHAHADKKEDKFKFREETDQNGVKFIILCGSNIESSKDAGKFALSADRVWFSAGIHPHDAGEDFSQIKDLLHNPKSVAVGETGLDYYYEFTARKKQILLFEESVKGALELKLPIIVHCRDKDSSEEAYKDCFDVLKDFSSDNGTFVMHCFTGSKYWLERFLSLGAYIGFGGIITFPKGENVRELLRSTPLNKVLFETDSPYLAPVPFRGKQNHSKYLPLIVKKASEVLNMELELLSRKSVDNAFNLFKRTRTI